MFSRGTDIHAADSGVVVGGDNNGLINTGTINYYISDGNESKNKPAVGTQRGVVEGLGEVELRQLATNLLRMGTPPSLLKLFPHAANSVHEAIEQLSCLQRTVYEHDSNQSKSTQIVKLTTEQCLHHLVVAAPGSGKTHALWQAAQEMLREGSLIPLFIPVGGLETWDDILQIVTDIVGDINATTVLRDSHVCVIFDGWSEFSSGQGSEERTRTMRILNGTRVIANGRRGMSSDAIFRVWNLNSLPVSAVLQAIRTALPEASQPTSTLVELLRLPLALSLFILLGGTGVTRGELLAHFHDHLSHGFPGSFRDMLAGAIASVSLSKQERSFLQLKNEIQARSNQAVLLNPLIYLEQLGTLEDRGGTAMPIHDLYWSWLSGLGLLGENRITASLPYLSTRESYELAIESGKLPSISMIDTACGTDVVLAGLLNSSLNVENAKATLLLSTLDEMFADERLPVRCRAALAALRSRDGNLLRSAFDVLTEVRAAGLYVPAFDTALIGADLFPNRGVIAEWVGSYGTDQLIEAIAHHGDGSWATWLEQMANSGKLPIPIAVATTLACDSHLPSWTIEHLPTLIKTQSWALRAVATRGANTELSRWIAEHYDEYVCGNNSTFIDLNKVLVGCGDEITFERLLARFPLMTTKAQETLGFAIVELGDPWLARFQEKAFESGDSDHHYKIKEVVSLDISDATARSWIAHEPSELGWRVLIGRYGNAIVSEMVEHLPESFDGLHIIPALSAMRYLNDPPDSLADEIWNRIRGSMFPRATEDVLYALAPIRKLGIPSVVARLIQNPFFLPAYHLMLFLTLLKEWEGKTGNSIRIKSKTGETSFAEWILLERLTQDRNDTFFLRTLASKGDLAIRVILDYFHDNEDVAKDLIGQCSPIDKYHEKLLEYLIESPNLATLIPKVFARTFDTFPEKILLRLINTPNIDFHELLRYLTNSSTPAHESFHKIVICKILDQSLDLFAYRDVAKILRVHPRQSLLRILKSVISDMTTNEMWLLREIETARRELLINERGEWLE